MRAVEQTQVGGDVGNCFEAAIASILELPIDVLPAAEPGNDSDAWVAYVDELRDWLGERGLDLFGIDLSPAVRLRDFDVAPRGFWIAGIPTPAAGWNHALVCLGKTVVHDPYPRRMRAQPVPAYLSDPTVATVWIVLRRNPAAE